MASPVLRPALRFVLAVQTLGCGARTGLGTPAVTDATDATDATDVPLDPRCPGEPPWMPTVVDITADTQFAVGSTWRVRQPTPGVVVLDDPADGSAALVADIPAAEADVVTVAAQVNAQVSTVLGASLAPVADVTVAGWPAVRSTGTSRPSVGASAGTVRDAVAGVLGLTVPADRAVVYPTDTGMRMDVTTVWRAEGPHPRAMVMVVVSPAAVVMGAWATQVTDGSALARHGAVLTEVCADAIPTVASAPVDMLWFSDTSVDMAADEDRVGDAAAQSFRALVVAGADLRAGVFQAGSVTSSLDLDHPGFQWIRGTDPDGARHLAYQVTFTRYRNDPADGDFPYRIDGYGEEPLAAGVIVSEAMSAHEDDGTYARQVRPDAVRVAAFATNAAGTGDDQDYFAMDPVRWGAMYLDRVQSVTRWYADRGVVPFGVADTFLNARCPTRENFIRCLTVTLGGPFVLASSGSDADVSVAASQLVTATAQQTGRYRTVSPAITSTLVVRVAGRVVSPSSSNGWLGWRYDAPSQGVVFPHGIRPIAGAPVRTSYDRWEGP